ncbi:DNA-binding response regulator [Paenibacillus marchantiophytorum]|uniref:DNA-binding response regulator n=1 Tax=Paenibacillus marchantiophytorum TaxID=1619310 RepID=A0ABQ1F8A4_9BACL|nr:response regulator [Paenibacillus marchantiophytorum]GGA02142.1 DNA-binding response regulator [Paenibacillus marchantiophytorum]
MYRILIAEDDKIERDGIKFLLNKYAFPLEIQEAKHGRAAMDILQEYDADVLLTDIKMPFMDGLQLTREARALKPQLKILILSGHGEFDYARTAISLQVSHYLLKPIEPEEFKSVLEMVIQQLDDERSAKLQQQEWRKVYEAGSLYRQEQRLRELTLTDEPDTDSRKRAIEDVLRIIEKEYEQDLSLEYLSKRVHLSASYLSHIFKKATGVSVVKYMNQYRMERAKYYLDQSNYKINDVYKMVGFSDMSYFGLTFKQYFGQTPTQYRDKVRTP